MLSNHYYSVQCLVLEVFILGDHKLAMVLESPHAMCCLTTCRSTEIEVQTEEDLKHPGGVLVFEFKIEFWHFG